MPMIGVNTITWDGKTIEVIYNDQSNDSELSMAGYNPTEDRMILQVPLASFPDSDRPKERELITFQARSWRILTIEKGDIQWGLTLVDPNKREN